MSTILLLRAPNPSKFNEFTNVETRNKYTILCVPQSCNHHDRGKWKLSRNYKRVNSG